MSIWLEEYTGSKKPHTKKSYEATIENHIKPALAKKKLQELTPVHIQQFINHLGNCKDSSKHGGYRFTTPKNNKPRQIIPAKFVMDVLRSQKRRQAEMKLAAGPMWNNSENLVFTNEVGSHLKHDLIYAVLSIQAGNDIKTVQENLGHYSAAFTLDVYGHVSDHMKRDSSERMDRYIHNTIQAAQ